MARPREPVKLLEFKGKKHLTKEEIRQREADEVIMGETDNDALARLVIAQERFEEANEIMNKVDFFDDEKQYEVASRVYAKRLDELRKLASDLGLTISSRCKLVVPKAPEKKAENKFSRFNRTG